VKDVKGSGRDLLYGTHNFDTGLPVSIVYLRTENQTLDLLNTKQDCQPLDREI